MNNIHTRRRRSSLSGAALILILPAFCGASEVGTRQGWYAGGGITAGNVFAAQGSGFSESSERGNADTGFVFSVGYRWQRHFAFEIGYLDGGGPTFRSIAFDACITTAPCEVRIEQTTTAFEASALAILPLGERWEIYMKAGVAAWDATSDQVAVPLGPGSIDSQRFETTGTDFMLGLGAGIDVGERTHARLEYQAFRTDNELLLLDSNREARFDQVSLELHWRF